MLDQEQRIRARAYRIWEEEGRPEGRAEVHWDMAPELIACHALAWRCKAAPVSLSAINGAQTPVVLVPRLARMALA